MIINKKTMDLIKSFEGLVLVAYPDPATKNDPIKKGEPFTVGYGTTIYNGFQKVKKGDVITKEQADAYLSYDVVKFSESVKRLITKPLNDNQFGAITSFAYNVGISNLKSSTLLKKINSNPNEYSIRDEFMRWNKANHKVMSGLTRRRSAEVNLYFS